MESHGLIVRNVTRSTTRFVRALSLPTEDLATVEASVALVEVETAVGAVMELCLDTVLLRLQPVVKFPARNAAMSPDRSAGWISLIK